MGGRGQSYTVVYRLKNFKNAKIPRNKLKNYLLNPTKDKNKATYFSSLGYNMKNYQLFEKQIRAKLATNKALKYNVNYDGSVSYQVNMQLGINKKDIVTTAWQIDKNSDIPRFITAYKNKSRKFKNRE